MALYKSEGTTLILALIPGLLCLNGVGHIYLGKIGKGIGLLIGSLVLGVVSLVTLVFGVGIVLLIIYVVIFIWQIFDAKKLCREYNAYVDANGVQPNW